MTIEFNELYEVYMLLHRREVSREHIDVVEIPCQFCFLYFDPTVIKEHEVRFIGSEKH